MKTRLMLDYKYIFNGYITDEGIDLVMKRIDWMFRDMLLGVRLEQGDTLNLKYSLKIPDDPYLPQMSIPKQIRFWFRRRVNLFKNWLCKCTH